MAAGQENRTHVRGAVNPVQTELPLMTGGRKHGREGTRESQKGSKENGISDSEGLESKG